MNDYFSDMGENLHSNSGGRPPTHSTGIAASEQYGDWAHSGPNGVGESPSKPDNMQPRSGRWIPIAIIVVLVLIIFACVAILLSIFSNRSVSGGQVAGGVSEASYRYGVVKTSERTLPRASVILTTIPDRETGDAYVLALRPSGDEAGGSYELAALDSGHSEVTEVAIEEVAEAQSFFDPESKLCEFVSVPSCQTVAKAIQVGDGIEVAWDDNEQKWMQDHTTYHAELIHGVVDDVVIGSTAPAEDAGSSRPSSIPVTNISAFDLHTGEELWTYNLSAPGFVGVGNNSVTVVEGTGISQALRDYFSEGQMAPSHVVEQWIQQVGTLDYETYRLEPAMQDRGDESEGVVEFVPVDPTAFAPSSDAIRQFDYLNTFYHQQMGCDGAPGILGGPGFPATAATRTPSNEQDCWLQMTNGSASFVTDLDLNAPIHWKIVLDPSTSMYVDLNQDGYDDLVVVGSLENDLTDPGSEVIIWIFDPEQPDNPMVFSVGGVSGAMTHGHTFDGDYLVFAPGPDAGLAVSVAGQGDNVTVSGHEVAPNW